MRTVKTTIDETRLAEMLAEEERRELEIELALEEYEKEANYGKAD